MLRNTGLVPRGRRRLDQGHKVQTSGHYDGDMEDLMAAAQEIELVREPPLGNLYGIQQLCIGRDNPTGVTLGTYPCHKDQRTYEIGNRHTCHPQERHASILRLPSKHDKPMSDENEARQSKGCVCRDLPAMVLGGSKLGEKGHGGTTAGCTGHQRPIGGSKTGVAEEPIVDHGDAGPPHQNDNSKVVEVVEEVRNARAVVVEGVEPVGLTVRQQNSPQSRLPGRRRLAMRKEENI